MPTFFVVLYWLLILTAHHTAHKQYFVSLLGKAMLPVAF